MGNWKQIIKQVVLGSLFGLGLALGAAGNANAADNDVQDQAIRSKYKSCDQYGDHPH